MNKTHVKTINNNKIYEFIEFTQRNIAGCTYRSNATHVKAIDLITNKIVYLPINIIEFID